MYKSKFTENFNYYESQFSKLTPSEYGYALQVRDEQGNATKWMGVTTQSGLEEIIDELRKLDLPE